MYDVQCREYNTTTHSGPQQPRVPSPVGQTLCYRSKACKSQLHVYIVMHAHSLVSIAAVTREWGAEQSVCVCVGPEYAYFQWVHIVYQHYVCSHCPNYYLNTMVHGYFWVESAGFSYCIIHITEMCLLLPALHRPRYHQLAGGIHESCFYCCPTEVSQH